MKITFSCHSCSSEFAVDESLAGKSGRCKKCGAKFVIPSPVAAVSSAAKLSLRPMDEAAASIPARAAAVDSDPRPVRPQTTAVATASAPQRKASEPKQDLVLKAATEQPPRLAKPNRSAADRKASPNDRSMGWLNAVNSQISMKPASLQNLLAVRLDDELQPDARSYKAAMPDWLKRSQKSKKRRNSVNESPYRHLFRQLGWFLRWLNETAYGISVLFMIMVCIGYILQMTSEFNHPYGDGQPTTAGAMSPQDPQIPQPVVKPPPKPQHRLITIGISGIVVLNLIRIASGVGNLVAIAFRQNPMQGILFLVPPMMIVYCRKHWNQVRKPVKRIIEPTVTLVVVLLAYMFIPGLGRQLNNPANMRDRMSGAMKSLKKDVSGSVDSMQKEVNQIGQKLPDQIDRAQKAAEVLQDKVQKALGDPAEPENK